MYIASSFTCTDLINSFVCEAFGVWSTIKLKPNLGKTISCEMCVEIFVWITQPSIHPFKPFLYSPINVRFLNIWFTTITRHQRNSIITSEPFQWMQTTTWLSIYWTLQHNCVTPWFWYCFIWNQKTYKKHERKWEPEWKRDIS